MILLLPAALASWTWAFAGRSGFREASLKALAVCAAACVVLTEALSSVHAFARGPVAIGWIAIALAAVPLWKRRTLRVRIGLLDAAFVAATAVILGIAGFTAWVSAPNSADAMAYHLPRIVYWVQNRSVAFFPATYLNQIMLQPFAEYAMAHTYLLAGGDRFVNLVAFTGFAGSVVAVSLIAREPGLSFRGQAIAALACATLPNGILQASGAKNDSWAALWIAAAVFFVARRSAWFLALSIGLAIGTKATAYLFLPPVLAAVWLISGRWRVRWREAGVIAAGVLALNAPQYLRNYGLSGSVLGYGSAYGNGTFRWRNDVLGWKPTVSNMLRNFSEQLGGKSEVRDRQVYDAVVRIHAALGIDPQDPRTTWHGGMYGPPRNANHEADANNRWHLLLAALALLAAALRPGYRRWLVYGAGLIAAFVAFCFYLKWQQYLARLELPLFILAAPLIAGALETLRPPSLRPVLPALVCLFLLDGTRHPLFDNWTRPLRGPASVLHEARDLQYFNDMGQFHNRDFYFAAAAKVLASGCETVGIDANANQLEYPLEALLLERNPGIRFEHVNVTNGTRRYAPAKEAPPCTIVQVR